MIIVKNASLTIGKKSILKNINLQMEEGHIYGLVGLNGCGKTMLMKCILGFVSLTEGSITVNGKQIGRDCEFAPDVGFLIEMPGFIPGYNGYHNLKQLARLQKNITKEEVLDCMEIAGIRYAANKKVSRYSLGMKQRLGIAQAIMGDPGTYLLDEPMNALDLQGVNRFRQFLLTEKQKGKLILLASHNHEDIEQLCDKVFEMKMGEL